MLSNEVRDPVSCTLVTVYKHEWGTPPRPCVHDGKEVACGADVTRHK